MSNPSIISKEHENIKIVINPSESTTKVFEGSNLIQQLARKDIIEFVKDTRRNIPDFKKNLENGNSSELGKSYTRIHHTILIDGERGSGKTSFMLSAIEALCFDSRNEDISSPENKQDSYCGLYSLGIIDPTLINNKDNIFILIVGKVHEAVESYFESTKHIDSANRRYVLWYEQMHKLARGLCNLDGVGTNVLMNEKWEDPQYILSEGLESARGGDKLEREFHRFINKSLEILKKDAFVIGFDDIDTNFSKGWPVLEVLRRYLTTPQLIVLLSGDYSMYSKLVRRQQWKMFKGHFELIEHLDRKKLRIEIEQLEDQYLRKILQPNRRIILKGAWELPHHIFVRQDGGINKSCSGGEGCDVPLRYFMQAFTRMLYKYPPAVCKRIGELFLHIPMRNIIDMLRTVYNQNESAYSDGYLCSRVYNYALSLRDSDGGSGGAAEQEVSEREVLSVHFQMILVHYDRLIALGFTNDDLRGVQWDGRFYRLTEVLYSRQLLKHGASLLPANVMLQDGLDILLMSGIYMSAMLSDIKHVVDYYVRVMMVRDVILFIDDREGQDQEDVKKQTKKYLEKFFTPRESLMDIANGVVRAYRQCKSPHSGAWSAEDKLIQVNGYDKNRSVLDRYLYNALVVRDKDDYYFSPYKLIALLGLCIGTTGDLAFELQKFRHPENLDESDAVDNQPDSLVSDEDNGTTAFCDSVHQWASKYHNMDALAKLYLEDKELSARYEKRNKITKLNLLLPPYVHSMIWSRFIDSIQPKSEISSMFYDISCKFLKSIKAEERLFLNKPNANTPFHDFIYACPLWEKLKDLEISVQPADQESNYTEEDK